MLVKKAVFLLALLCVNISFGHTTQRPSRSAGGDDDANPLLDMASMFIQEALNNQNNNGGRGGGGGGAAGLAGIASMVGSFMQANSGGQGKSAGGSGAMQILSGIGSLLASAGNNNGARNGGGGGGFDPSIIGNVIEMFTQGDDNEDDGADGQHHHQKRESDSGIDLGSILQIASAFMGQNNEAPSHHHHQQKRSVNTNSATPQPQEDNGLMSLLPLVMQAVSSFAGPEGQHTQEKHRDHAWVLPPFLEHLHVLWDHFSNSELADALYEKSGVNKIMKGFKGRDGKLDYDKLFESLNNQSFRRRWIKSATLYLADWASYLANPEVYLKYFQTAQLMFNGFLKSQGYPKTTFFDPSRPSETISNLLDHVAKHHLNVKIDSRQYVKPAVGYAKDLMKLGQARGVLQFNATDISDKLTDTLNLEVIEPVLKVHRAYRYVMKQPHCDRYVLCQLNDAEQYSVEESRGLISGVSPKIVKVGSMGAAFFISTETGTPFWTLFSVITTASNCEVKYPVDCTGFHEGEAKVTTEYIHNEL
ncbi:hypothetical protein FF38_13462 [Lucilia cuprina]|uniref:Uncharacterized protein n=1 Tax=Lucilia cuprina TaxID=7375 RepID=A0A0L0BRC1_LUCCU|nr:hypothetical protein CVS40_12489 [Lucilia cuprina]KAI8115267.1 hypothetical protein CVS40_12489 [Lucilia cuprina]KNC22533.1 hypothetical protein FF38_13462 [Lucilia cuprina]